MDQKQINDLLTKMTLEKISQLLQLTANLHEGTEDQSQITGPMEEMGITGEMVGPAARYSVFQGQLRS